MPQLEASASCLNTETLFINCVTLIHAMIQNLHRVAACLAFCKLPGDVPTPVRTYYLLPSGSPRGELSDTGPGRTSRS